MRRMFFNNNKRNKKEAMELDITSLLDVLVILLVFLLKSYNASSLKLNLVKDLVVPNSDARTLGAHALVIQVDGKKNVYINNKKVANIASRRDLAGLEEKLLKKREEEKKQLKHGPKKVNLVFDKDVPYEDMKKIMHTSAMVGYTEFKFIVQGNY